MKIIDVYLTLNISWLYLRRLSLFYHRVVQYRFSCLKVSDCRSMRCWVKVHSWLLDSSIYTVLKLLVILSRKVLDIELLLIWNKNIFMLKIKRSYVFFNLNDCGNCGSWWYEHWAFMLSWCVSWGYFSVIRLHYWFLNQLILFIWFRLNQSCMLSFFRSSFDVIYHFIREKHLLKITWFWSRSFRSYKNNRFTKMIFFSLLCFFFNLILRWNLRFFIITIRIILNDWFFLFWLKLKLELLSNKLL